MKYLRKISILFVTLLILTLIGMSMYNSSKKNWFEGSSEIECSGEHLMQMTTDLGSYFTKVISNMPSMLKVELVEQGEAFVTIQTNEGLMKRSNIVKRMDDNRLIIEFDEIYEAGKTVTTSAHFMHAFDPNDQEVRHHLQISNLKAPGFMGFFYRTFGSASMGKAFLKAHKTVLEDSMIPQN